MAMSGVRRNFSSLFGILTIVMYLFGFLIIGRGLSFRNILIIVVALLMYYVANIFSIRAKKYSLRELILSVGLNFILLLFTIMLKILGIYESIVLFGIVTMFQITFRYIVNMVIVRKQKILFVGENSYTKDLLESIKNDDQYKLMGFLKDEKDETLKKIVLKMCAVGKIDIIVDFGEELLKDSKLVDILLQYKLNGLQFYNYLEFYEMYENKLPVSHLSSKWFLENSGFEIYYNNFNLRAKRLLDLIFAIIIGICTLPLMIMAAIIVKLESKGPIFFVQERIGEGNKKFNIVKFRSMTTDAEKNGPQWASKNDNRVTRWGKIMRATRIDELPQLWNVLRGEMSFVGPRPEREYFIQQLEKEIPYYNLRHTVKPGLTGWAQVMYPYGASVEDAYRKLQYDLYYIKHHDIIFDIKVLLKTITIVIFGKGR